MLFGSSMDVNLYRSGADKLRTDDSFDSVGTITQNNIPVVTTSGAQTLTNKTLTSPVVNTPTGIVKGDVGLANVDNTSDASKPVSTAGQTALNLKANLVSPTFTGTVTVPTPSNATDVATKGYVDSNVGSALLDTWRKRPFLFCDFLATGTSSLDPFLGIAIASGTISAATVGTFTAQHPGNVRFVSSTTPNSGVYIGSNTIQLLLSGGEVYEAVFRLETLTLSTFRLGFLDTTTSADAVDGVYVEVDSTGVATGKTSNNSTRSTTATTLTLTATTWYRLRIVVNSTSLATFTIYDDAGAELWTNTLTTNIPTASGRETGAGVTATNSGTLAVGLLTLDFMALTWSSDRVR